MNESHTRPAWRPRRLILLVAGIGLVVGGIQTYRLLERKWVIDRLTHGRAVVRFDYQTGPDGRELLGTVSDRPATPRRLFGDVVYHDVTAVDFRSRPYPLDELHHLAEWQAADEIAVRFLDFRRDDVEWLLENRELLSQFRGLHIHWGEAFSDLELEQLGQLPNMVTFWSNANAMNEIAGGWKSLQFWPRLTSVRFGAEADDTALEHLQDDRTIWFVGLRGSRVTGAGLNRMATRSVQFLDVSHTQFDDSGLKAVGQLEELMFFNAAETPLCGTGLVHLANAPALKRIDLRGTAIDDETSHYLVYLEQVEELNLRGCNISDQSLNHLTQMPRLQSVDLRETNVSEEGARGLWRESQRRLAVRYQWEEGFRR